MTAPDYRTLWTWDFGTCWDQTLFVRERGSSGKNGRRAMFLEDYKRLVGYAAAHHINGVVIWGAVRAHQDGFAQLRELVRYGRAHGVRILPGVSAFSYGGVCYDPRTRFDGVFDIPMEDHPCSLFTWLKRHPEYAAVDKDGKPYEFGPFNVVACPSRPENLEWFRSSLDWLYDEFDVDGIQVEVGDYALCHCPLCARRRATASYSPYYSISDMLNSYTAAIEVSRRHKPDAWVICETYSSPAVSDGREYPDWGGWAAMPEPDRRLLSALPEHAILQWGVDRAVGGYARQVWPERIFLPSKDNILRIHAGSQWAQNGPADWGVELVWETAERARTHGINGSSVFGEESCFSPPNEANYLAFEAASGFGKDRSGAFDLSVFYSGTLDPLYGGAGMAEQWRSLYIKSRMLLLGQRLGQKRGSAQKLEALTDDPSFREKALGWSDPERAGALRRYFAEARALSASLSGDPCRRWSWLENSISNTLYIIASRV